MDKTITFTRKFPKTHPKGGQETLFAEKILNNLGKQGLNTQDAVAKLTFPIKVLNEGLTSSKGHTIRKELHHQIGDILQPYFWEAEPGHSQLLHLQIELNIVQVWSLTINPAQEWFINGHRLDADKLTNVAHNDGLQLEELVSWLLPEKGIGFEGQIICWDPQIHY